MRRNKRRPILSNPQAALRRVVFIFFSILGLVGLLSCQQSQKHTSDSGASLPGRSPVRELPVEPARAVQIPTRMASGEPVIRVSVVKDAQSARVSSGGCEARIFGASGQEVAKIAPGAAVDISAGPGGLVFSGRAFNETRMRIESTSPDVGLRLNGQETAGRLQLAASRAGVNVVAQLGLEEYLVGVLAGEVPFERWHSEALKAQAVTSRSYALYQIKNHAGEPYDVESTVMSQVFRSGYRHNPILSSVVSSTRGLVMTNNGAPFSAYFHSTCGGHTDPSSYVFPDREPARPFTPVTCGYCSQSPSSKWKLTLEKRAIERKLQSQFNASQHLSDVVFLDANNAPIGPEAGPMRRVSNVMLKRSDGTSVKLVANVFRLAVGAKELKSMAFETVVDRGGSIELGGCGFGHGVGLCQWGSQGMAQAGYTHLQILGKYYSGAALTKLY